MMRYVNLRILSVFLFVIFLFIVCIGELRPNEDTFLLRILEVIAEKKNLMFQEDRLRNLEFHETEFAADTVIPKVPLPTTTTTTTAALPYCNKRGEKLLGRVFIDQTVPKDISDIEKTFSVASGGIVEKGGWWSPTTCKPRAKVAIIIPYRNRHEQLKVYLRHMHNFLPKQEIYYQIFVVEQLEEDPFNRAGLFNVGFVEALKLADFDCFVFSDVDLLPEDDRNYYGCPTSPRHMSVAVDKFNYSLPYTTIFGGVGALSRKHFEKVNGFSNSYWGWGGEDDDLYERLVHSKLSITRPSLTVGRYTMVKIHHFQSSEPNPHRVALLENATRRMASDGLNTLTYRMEEIDQQPLVTFLKVVLSRSMYN